MVMKVKQTVSLSDYSYDCWGDSTSAEESLPQTPLFFIRKKG